MITLDALKELGVKLGCADNVSEISGDNIADVIKYISDKAQISGASEEQIQNIIENSLYDTTTTMVYPTNLMPSNDEEISGNGVTVTLVNGVITVSGTYTGSSRKYFWFDKTLQTREYNDYGIVLQNWSTNENANGKTMIVVKNSSGKSVQLADNSTAWGQRNADTSWGDAECQFGVGVESGFTGTIVLKPTVSMTGDKLNSYVAYFDPYEQVSEKALKESVYSEKVKKNGNLLYGKKWAVCGDSFTDGNFTGSTDSYTFTDGVFKGLSKVYPRLIADRNNMELQWMARGGRTLAETNDSSFTNSFSLLYKKIDSDVDYITLYFGINDSHHRTNATESDGEDTTGTIELGTINDTVRTTFYGAWNVILAYLIEKYPNAKIGILVSNGCETDDYRIATIACAKKWGIPYIDLNGDDRTPVMSRSTNPDISNTVKTLRNNAWKVSGSNTHPNVKAHEYESVFIENFLRTL